MIVGSTAAPSFGFFGKILPGARCIPFEGESTMNALREAEENDLVIAAFGLESFMAGANRFFSPFRKPRGVKARYAFIRLDIPEKALLEALSEKPSRGEQLAKDLMSAAPGTWRVTAPGGTDITLFRRAFEDCPSRITSPGGMAFLPPSEVSSFVETAEGTVVCDVTAGQLVSYGKMLGYFGITDSPITLRIENGMITDISGGAMAAELREKLFALPEGARKMVELGFGLSPMSPTGIIGVDESILGTCHFGFGDASECGVHLDMVVKGPITGEKIMMM